MPFQDVAKAGLKFGDEELDAEEKREQISLTEKFQPLLKWLRNETKSVVRDGTSSLSAHDVATD